jgi:microcystin-dependent protein
MPKKIPDWKDKKPEKDKHKGVKGKHDDKPKAPPATPHQQITPATNLPQGLTVDNLRVDGDLDLSIFDDLEPDQDFMIMPSAPTQDHVYTVNFDPLSGKQVVAATDPVTIVTAPPDYSEVTSDGGTPSTPSITLVSGPGWIKVKWDASTGTSDPLYYKVFAREAADPTTADDTYLVATTENLESIVNKLTGGTQLATGTTYHFAVKAYSRVSGGGTSTASTVVTGTPAVVDASVTTISHLNASTIDTGTLSASFISTGTLSATVTLSGTIKTSASGARVELDGTNGLRVYDGSANNYGVGAGITTKLPIGGTPFFYGTIYAQGIQFDRPSGIAGDSQKIRWDSTSSSFTMLEIYSDQHDGLNVGTITAWAEPGDDADLLLEVRDGDGGGQRAAMMFSGADADDQTTSQPNNIRVLMDSVDGLNAESYEPYDYSILEGTGRSDWMLNPIGLVAPFAGHHSSLVPRGWLLCDGTEYDTATDYIYGPSDLVALKNILQPLLDGVTSITAASPGVVTVSSPDIPVSNGDAIIFIGSGSLPTGLTKGTQYFIVSAGVDGSDTFRVAATRGGAAINTSGSAMSGSILAYYSPYGGVSSGTAGTKFKVPDLRQRVPVGLDGSTFANAGKTGGEETHVLTSAELASHTHGTGTLVNANESSHTHGNGSLATSNNTTTVADGNGGTLYRASGAGGLGAGSTVFARQGGSTQQLIAESHNHTVTGTTAAGSAHTHTISGSTASTGSDTAHNNLQPYITMHYIIKAA